MSVFWDVTPPVPRTHGPGNGSRKHLWSVTILLPYHTAQNLRKHQPWNSLSSYCIDTYFTFRWKNPLLFLLCEAVAYSSLTAALWRPLWGVGGEFECFIVAFEHCVMLKQRPLIRWTESKESVYGQAKLRICVWQGNKSVDLGKLACRYVTNHDNHILLTQCYYVCNLTHSWNCEDALCPSAYSSGRD
jgi:hypothetical protein